jgi:hypothetical protein
VNEVDDMEGIFREGMFSQLTLVEAIDKQQTAKCKI